MTSGGNSYMRLCWNVKNCLGTSILYEPEKHQCFFLQAPWNRGAVRAIKITIIHLTNILYFTVSVPTSPSPPKSEEKKRALDVYLHL